MYRLKTWLNFRLLQSHLFQRLLYHGLLQTEDTANARSHVEVHQEVYKREAKAMPRGESSVPSINCKPNSTFLC